MSVLNITSCGRALLINLRVAWMATPATSKSTCIGRSSSETQERTDCTVCLLAIHLNTLPMANCRMHPFILPRAVYEDANNASRDSMHHERFSFTKWFARWDIELRSRYPGSYASMPKRSRIWQGRNPSTPPLLLPAKNLMAARIDSGVAHNGEHWSRKGKILVSTDAGGCLERSTAITSSVEATCRSAAEKSPSIILYLTETLRRLWQVLMGEVFG